MPRGANAGAPPLRREDFASKYPVPQTRFSGAAKTEMLLHNFRF
jgi:hypothetical protein